jgi:7-carboxy-7-deazaguanine synthase
MTVRVSEIFGPTIQGEGAMIGLPTLFVRTGGCDYRCSWCDTPHAVLSENRATWVKTEEHEIVTRLEELALAPMWVTLSGGNPALQNCEQLVLELHTAGYDVCVETQGSLAPLWLRYVDHLVVSPKPPSSGMETDWEVFLECCKQASKELTVKVVVSDEKDLAYAIEAFDNVATLAHVIPLHSMPRLHLAVQPCNATFTGEFNQEAALDRTRWLVDEITSRRMNQVRVLPQLHSLLWGNKIGV